MSTPDSMSGSTQHHATLLASQYLHVHGDAAVRGEGKGVFRHSQDQRVPLAIHQGGAAEGHSGLPGACRVLAEEEEVQPGG